MARIISMVPSWTETLLEAGVEVVGRTRFCLYPQDKVKSIPIVGGTKSICWEKTKDLQADFLLLDREENTLEMAEKSPIKNLVSHICEVKDVAPFLANLSRNLQNEKLLDYSERWSKITQKNIPKQPLEKIPCIKEWINPLKRTCQQFVYLIWRDPWMCVSKNTFIGSIFNHLGLSTYHWSNNEKYPQIDIESFNRKTTLLLCSTEPFPFHHKKDDLQQLGFSCAIIDGESYSWFGYRSLLFLENEI